MLEKSQKEFNQSLMRPMYCEIYLRCLIDITQEAIDTHDFNVLLPKIVKRLKSVSEADRCYLFENRPAEGDSPFSGRVYENADEMDNQYEYDLSSDTIAPYGPDLNSWISVLKNKEIICGSIGSFASEKQEVMRAKNIRCILILPLFIWGKWFGFIGFEGSETKSEWNEREIAFLKLAANSVCSVIERASSEGRLVESEARYKELFDQAQEGIGLVDANETIQLCNSAYARIFEMDSVEEMLGKNLLDFIPEEQKKHILSQTLARKRNISSLYELDIITARGNPRCIFASVSPRFDTEGNYIGAFGTVIDITERKDAEKKLQKAYDNLEIRIQERTRQLEDVNRELTAERETLNQRTIALKEILNQIEEEKRQIELKIQANIDRVIVPIIARLKKTLVGADKKMLALLEESLNDIASSFLTRLETQFSHLTSREIEICGLIKNGQTTKEIARAFNTSELTVLSQRKIIRRKLKISQKKINLASFLKRIEI